MPESHPDMISLAPGVDVPEHYGDWLAEYRAARHAVAFMNCRHRGLVDVRGSDRAAWLHNLVTNEVRKLSAGEGVYAFAVNLKGRTLFDLNVLVEADRIRLDIDRRFLNCAIAHLERHRVTEDVSLADRTGEFARFALLGERLKPLFAGLGLPNVPLMADIHHASVDIGGVAVTAFRHDFAGVPGVELIASLADRDRLWNALRDAGRAHNIRPAGWRAVQALRIEHGVPWSVQDIDEQVIPPETGRIEQGISYHKGCYLGQEVIERMRSHGVLARRLVGVRVDGDRVPEPGAELRIEDKAQGRVTSACHSPTLGAPLVLGYLATPHASAGRAVSVRSADISLPGRIVALPVPDQ